MVEDGELLLGFSLRGDVPALSELVHRTEGWLMGYLRGMSPTEADAEDAFQECWARVIKSAGAYRGGAVRSYLMKIARSVVIDRFRRRGAPTCSLDDEAASGLVESLSDAAPTPAERLELNATSADVRLAVRSLPTGMREVLLMRIEGELAFREIAEELGIPLGTALTWMHAATIRLRKALGGVK